MKLETQRFTQYGETMHYGKLRNRLGVYYIEKPGFAKTYVTINVPLGAIHEGYEEEGKRVHVPRGIAHFLEHKVFEKDGADISKEFSMDEASINAFTEHHQTTYLFSAAANVARNTTRLINMVFNPGFSSQGVESEKSIIAEELNMHFDDPAYKQYVGLINAMYHAHPIKDDILGTRSDIEAMDYDTLRTMHAAYYQPERCALIVVGDLGDPQTFFQSIEANVQLPEPSLKKPLGIGRDEPGTVAHPRTTQTLDVRMPSVLYGIKFTPIRGVDTDVRIKERLALSMWLDLCLGRTSDYYESLLDKGLINDSYGLELNYDKDYAYALIGSETTQPDALAKALSDALSTPEDLALEEADFTRLKRQMLGNFIHSLDSPETIAHQFAHFIQESVSYYEVIDVAMSLSFADVKAKHKAIAKHSQSVFIIKSNA